MKQLIEEQREDFKKNKKTYWDTFGNLATEELISIHSEYLKQLIDGLIAYKKEFVNQINKNNNGTKYEEGFKEAIEMSIAHLKDLRSQIK